MSSPTTMPTVRTADEFGLLPDDGYRYELVRGELRRSMAAGFRHGVLAGRLLESLAQVVDDQGLGVERGPTARVVDAAPRQGHSPFGCGVPR